MADQIIDKIASSVLENAIIGIMILNQDLKSIYVNKKLEKITGYSTAEFYRSDSIKMLVSDEKYYNLVRNKLVNCEEKPFDDLDIKLVKKDKAAIPVHITGFHIRGEEEKYVVVVIQDVSSKKAFEKVLETSFDNFIQTTKDLDEALKKIKEQRTILEEYQVKMKRELQIAKNVQKSIIPKEYISNDYINIWGVSIPSQELGGDFFDYFKFDNSKQGILIADVSGHGVPSALITTMIKVYFERYAREFVEVDKVFTYINNEITKTILDTGFYFTSFYSVIDLDTMLIFSASAGHDYAICYIPEEDQFIELGSTGKGTIIGTFKEAEYESSSYQLSRGCKVIYFTDGITEARNNEGEFYGIERVKKFTQENYQLSAKDFVVKIIDDIDIYYNGATPNDDRTIVVVDIVDIPDIKRMSQPQLQEIIETAFRNGRKYIKLKQYNAAMNEFRKIRQFEPDSSAACSYLGQLAGIQGDYMKAEELLKESISLDAAYLQGYYFLGIILFKQRKYKEAKECWSKLKRINGNFKNVNAYIKKIEQLGV